MGVYVSVRAGHWTVSLPEMEQRVRPADSGGQRRPAAAQQLRREALLPQIHLLCQRVVRNQQHPAPQMDLVSYFDVLVCPLVDK